jgi:streptomycin 6-kinase
MGADFEALSPWLARWGLEPDGAAAFETPYTRSRLLPVRRAGVSAMLKIAATPEGEPNSRGNQLGRLALRP